MAIKEVGEKSSVAAEAAAVERETAAAGEMEESLIAKHLLVVKEVKEENLRVAKRAEMKMTQLEEDLSSATRELEVRTTSLGASTTDSKKREEQMTQLSNELVKCKSERVALEKKLKNEKEQHVEKCEEFEERLDKSEKETKKMEKKQLVTEEEKKDLVKNHQEEVAQTVAQTGEERKSWKEEIETMRKKMKKNEKERTKLMHELDQAKHEGERIVLELQRVREQKGQDQETTTREMNEKEEKLSRLEESLRLATGEKENVEELLRKTEREKNSLEKTLTTQLKDVTKEQETFIIKTTREREEMKKAVQTLEEEKIQLLATSEETRTELNGIKVQLNGVTHEKEMFENKIKRLDIAMKNLLKEEEGKRSTLVTTHATSVTALKMEWNERESVAKLEWPDEARETKRKLEEETHEYKDQISQVSSTLETLKIEFEREMKKSLKTQLELEEHRINRPLEMERAREETKILREKIETKHRESVEEKNECATLKLKLEHDCMTSEVERKNLQIKLDETETRRTQAESKLTSMRAELSMVTQEKDDLTARLEPTSTMLSMKTNELEEMFQQISNLRTKLAKEEEAVKLLKEEKIMLTKRETNQLERFNEEHASTQVLERQLRQAYEDLDGERKAQEKRVKDLQEEKNHLSKVHHVARQETDRLMLTLKNFEEEKKNRVDSLEEAKEKERTMKEQHGVMETSLSKVREERRKMDEKHRVQSSELTLLRKKIGEKENALLELSSVLESEKEGNIKMKRKP